MPRTRLTSFQRKLSKQQHSKEHQMAIVYKDEPVPTEVPAVRGECFIRQWNRNLIGVVKIGKTRADGIIETTYLQMQHGHTVSTLPVVMTKVDGWTPLSKSDYNLFHSALGSKDMFAKAEEILENK